jgi:hypothetical protein
MPAPEGTLDWTGNVQFRKGLFGGLTLYLEYISKRELLTDKALETSWRVVKENDLWRLKAVRENRKMPPLL